MDNKDMDKGLMRKVDKLGRVVIPIEIRNTFELEYETPMEIFVEDNKIILKKYVPNCIFCGNNSDLEEYEGKLICKECIEKIGKKEF